MEKNSKQIVITYRYMWRYVGSDSINFKIVSDTPEGHVQFQKLIIEELSTHGDLLSVVREYLHEYDCSKVGLISNLYNKEAYDEKSKN